MWRGSERGLHSLGTCRTVLWTNLLDNSENHWARQQIGLLIPVPET